MKFVIAPDSFKGCMTAKQAGEAIRAGLLRVFPDAEYVMVPMADGGEGTGSFLGGRHPRSYAQRKGAESVAVRDDGGVWHPWQHGR